MNKYNNHKKVATGLSNLSKENIQNSGYRKPLILVG